MKVELSWMEFVPLWKGLVYWSQIAFLAFISSPSLWLSLLQQWEMENLPASLRLWIFRLSQNYPLSLSSPNSHILGFFSSLALTITSYMGFLSCSIPSCWLISIKSTLTFIILLFMCALAWLSRQVCVYFILPCGEKRIVYIEGI